MSSRSSARGTLPDSVAGSGGPSVRDVMSARRLAPSPGMCAAQLTDMAHGYMLSSWSQRRIWRSSVPGRYDSSLQSNSHTHQGTIASSVVSLRTRRMRAKHSCVFTLASVMLSVCRQE